MRALMSLNPGRLRLMALAGLACGLALALLWASGGLQPLAAWVAAQQKAVQSALAGAVRALRAGQPGAWAGLLGICFAYGALHAAGPGHGKAVIGGYGLARRVRLMPLMALALGSSLAQSAVAVALVGGGALLLGWSRAQMEGWAESVLTPASYALVAGLGLWLVWRGAGGLRAQHRASASRHGGADGAARLHHAPHHHHHHHQHTPSGDGTCGCGHSHGPTAEQVAQVTGLRDAALLIASVALRPCSGAIFLLILCFAMGIGWAGVAGAFAMGLGTAAVTVLVAAFAFAAREGVWSGLFGAGGQAARLTRVLPGVELLAGLIIALLSLSLLAASL